jgi:putative membrane-bound dehydrogenase-like protein
VGSFILFWNRLSFEVPVWAGFVLLAGLMKMLFAILMPLGATFADDFPEVYNSEKNQKGEPMSPEEAAKAFKVPEGFEVTVFAAEPEVRNPIAMAWDHKGRMWVAENYTYAEKEKRFDLSLRDRIVIFEDADRDGKAEKRTVFSDTLQMLTSVEVQPGGVWAMCPPQLLFIPDANGDDVPDGEPEVVLDGFTVAKSNYHNFANGLRWGPDGWLYGRCGGSCPGSVGAPGTPDVERVPLRGGIWRYHPKRKFFEVIVHGTTNPWGHDWDQHGEGFFINTVNGHLWHMIPGGHFDRPSGRSANDKVYEAIQMHSDHWHYDQGGSWTKSRNGAANDFGGGHSHIGMCIYQGDHLPKEWQGKLLTWNQHGKRLNVERLEREGSGYVARHEPDQFLAGDDWFRGLDIREGSDGALYGLDWSDTGECHDHTGVHRTSGRIYRFSHGEAEWLSAAEAMKRPRVQRYFFGEGSSKMHAGLRTYLGQNCPVSLRAMMPSQVAGGGPISDRLKVLWLLNSLGAVGRSSLAELLSDPNEHMRVWAIRLLTDEWPIDSVYGPMPHRKPPSDPKLRDKFVEMAKKDSSGLVRLALASTLQRMPLEDRAVLASALVSRAEDAKDHNLPKLVWFGISYLGEEKLTVAKATGWPDLLRYIARSSVDEPKWVEAVLQLAVNDEAKSGFLLTGLMEGFKGWKKAPMPSSWKKISAGLQKSHPKLTREFSALFGDGRAMDSLKATALNNKEKMPVRKRALEALIDAKVEGLRGLCEELFWTNGLCATAVKGLAEFDDPLIGESLTKNHRKLYQVEDKAAVIDALVTRPRWAGFLLGAMKKGDIPQNAVTPFHARQILAMKDEALKTQLNEIWGEVRQSNEVVKARIVTLGKSLASEVRAKGDMAQGRVLFQTLCATCHRLFGQGGKLGPDLTGSGRADLGYLLENIVDPNSVVPVEYQMSLVKLKNKRVLSGVVSASNDRTVTLRTLTDEVTLEKSAIAETTLLPDSMMPPGLLDTLSAEQTRDLIAYLMHPQQVALPEEKK